ncbi:MAG: alpha/beta hydrolase family esterase [Janthinobacterium lividum]
MRAVKPFLRLSSLCAVMVAMASAPTRHAHAQSQVTQPVIAASDGSTACTPPQAVAISDATAGAMIYYTTDGTTPTTSSTLYHEGDSVTLAGTKPLIARAFADGYQQSDTVAATPGKLLTCNQEITIPVGDVQRTFWMHVPATYSAKRTQTKPSPLLIDFHGYQYGETADQVVDFEIDNSGELEMSNKYGFVAIWPEASIGYDKGNQVHSWNGIYCCGPAWPHGADDVAFGRAIITWAETNALIDPKRVYVTGHSNGAQMTHRMACDASDVVTAIAPVAWPINEPAANCVPTHAMPVIEVHGTDDQTIKYPGNTIPPSSFSDPPVTTSAAAGAEVWREINDCDTALPVEKPLTFNGITYKGPESGYPDVISKIRGSHCKSGVYTGLISIYNAPHVVFQYALNNDNFNVAQFFWDRIFDGH